MNRRTDVLLLVVIAVAAGCALKAEAEVDAIQGDATLHPMGLKVGGGTGQPPPDPNHRAECLDTILTDPRLMCIFQGLGVGGAQTLEDQQNAAVGCGCTADLVTTQVPNAEPGTQRVAIGCPGDPEFFGVFSPPTANPDEPPFIGIHINPYPDDINSKMCDVKLTDSGVGPRQTNEDCSQSSCHGQKLRAQWFPAVEAPAPPVVLQN